MREANAMYLEEPTHEGEAPAFHPSVDQTESTHRTEVIDATDSCRVFRGVNPYSEFVFFHVFFETSLSSPRKKKRIPKPAAGMLGKQKKSREKRIPRPAGEPAAQLAAQPAAQPAVHSLLRSQLHSRVCYYR